MPAPSIIKFDNQLGQPAKTQKFATKKFDNGSAGSRRAKEARAAAQIAISTGASLFGTAIAVSS